VPVPSRLIALGLSSLLAIGPGAPAASAYPIDCAILLCMAGGFPASAECTAAKAEMIQRITPFPVEPPLQIWRCPLRSAARAVPGDSLAAVIPVRDTPVGTPADVPLEDPAFDFVTSIKVYDIDWWHRDTNDDENLCLKYRSKARLGHYSGNGQFYWSAHDRPDILPDFVGAPSFAPSVTCTHPGRWRGVVIEWADHAGNPDHEVIRY
jgi:hypothetical protein